MTDRFTLEEQINKCWCVTEDIDLLYRSVMNQDMSRDEIANALLGLKTLYDMKYGELWETFTFLIYEKKIT